MAACFYRNPDCGQFEQPHCVVGVVAGGTVLAVLQSHGTSWGPDRPQWLPSFQRGHQTHVGGELELSFLPWYFPAIFWKEPSTVEELLSLSGTPLDFIGWNPFVWVSCKLVLRTLSMWPGSRAAREGRWGSCWLHPNRGCWAAIANGGGAP